MLLGACPTLEGDECSPEGYGTRCESEHSYSWCAKRTCEDSYFIPCEQHPPRGLRPAVDMRDVPISRSRVPRSAGRNNLVWDNAWATDGDGENVVDADPKFVNDKSGDFRLRAGSPAIDAGTSMGLQHCGKAPDIGAFEAKLEKGRCL